MMNNKSPHIALWGCVMGLALAACAGSAALSPAPTPAQPASPAPPTPVETAVQASSPAPDRAELLSRVSADRLIADVRALSAIPSRHVNNPGVTQAAQYIHDQLAAAGGHLQVSEQAFPLAINGIATTQRNVIATLPGSDPAAGVVLVGAHYDSRTRDLGDSVSVAPGANDNATGTAAVIELARVLANETPRATLLFVAFSGEEEGRLGSKYFIASLSSRPVIHAMIALDIIGMDNSPGGSARLYSAGPDGSPSRLLAKTVAQDAQAVEGFSLDLKDAPDRPGRYSDHITFSDAGYPAVRFIQPQEDDSNHSAGDTANRVNPVYLARVTQVVLASLADLGWSH